MHLATIAQAPVVTLDPTSVGLIVTIMTGVYFLLKFGDRFWGGKNKEEPPKFVQSPQCGYDHDGINQKLEGMTEVLAKISSHLDLTSKEINLRIQALHEDVRSRHGR